MINKPASASMMKLLPRRNFNLLKKILMNIEFGRKLEENLGIFDIFDGNAIISSKKEIARVIGRFLKNLMKEKGKF